MSIGTNIRKLRRERDLTQEALADYLGISVGAVSQWERDRTSPDISQLPLLASIFDVTTDEILGVDRTKNERKIEEIAERAFEFYARADFAAAAEILREGLKEFPRSYFLMVKLAEYSTDREECIRQSETVFEECPDPKIRYEAVTALVNGYRMIGNKEQAIRYAGMMPSAWCSKEDLLMFILDGEEAFENLRDYAKFCVGRLFIILHQLCEIKSRYTAEERMELCRQRIKIGEAIFSDGDYSYDADLMARAYDQLAELYAERKDAENTLACLRAESEYRKIFDTYDESAPNTSPAVRGYVDGGWIRKEGEYTVSELIGDMENAAVFDFLRGDEEFSTLLGELKAWVG